jgi:DNA-3-methyladenine glycosylase II
MPDSLKDAEVFLSKSDAKLRALISRTGPCTMFPPKKVDIFASLVRSIGHQQLTGKAAETILGRLKVALKNEITPKALLKLKVPQLRACGLSNAKAVSLIDLANKSLDGSIPIYKNLNTLDDDQVVDVLCQVRGIGPWTGHMFQMFQMGRLDILPTGDYGVRKGFTLLYKKKELVTPKALELFAEKWRPYRSVASWYMWRVLDEQK